MAKKAKVKSKKPKSPRRAKSAGKKSQKKPSGRAKLFSGVCDDGSRVVQQAATVLEEEIAAGIIAAKKIQKNLLDKGRFDPRDFDSVIRQLQKDAHEIVNVIAARTTDTGARDTGELVARFQTDAGAAIDILASLAQGAPEVLNMIISGRNTPKKPRRKK